MFSGKVDWAGVKAGAVQRVEYLQTQLAAAYNYVQLQIKQMTSK